MPRTKETTASRLIAQGRAQGVAITLLGVLERRGFEVSKAIRKRVLECTDDAVFDRWLDRVLDAQSADDIFLEP